MSLAIRATLFAWALVAASLQAQDPANLRPRVFAIRNARVVTAPGQVLPKATIVIRDGLIADVGPDIAVPPDALAIDGKDMVVYAGFIDALSHSGFDPAQRRTLGGPPEPIDFAQESLATTKADNRKGLTPEFSAASSLRDEEPTQHWRKAGVTVRLVAPDGGLITGQSALVSLSGLASRETILRANLAMHGAFRSAAGEGFPRSQMGNVAHVRQMLLDAGHYQRLWQAYEKRGRTGARPAHDAALEALAPVLARKQPLIFEADTRDAIQRVLDLADEFQVRPIIYGGRDAWKLAPVLKLKNVPVIVRIAFSEPNGEREKDWPQRAKDEQRVREYAEARNPALLHQSGVKFAFSMASQPGDHPWTKFRENLRRAIAVGLPADAALAALTTNSAEVLGVADQLGTIARGRPANLVVLDGEIHDANVQTAWVFADGMRFQYDFKPRDAQSRKPMEPIKAPAAISAIEHSKRDHEIEPDRIPVRRTGGSVLIRGATILTVTQGTIPKGEIQVDKGKIVYVGPEREIDYKGKVIDADGMFIMPGIIDTHSHFSIEGGVNEFSLSVVPEVRVRDVIDSEDVAIFRGLAGAVTTSRLLHGSANCIGGQDAVIKLKYRTSAKDMLIAEAPRGVKFALGENVKRSDGRFPNTRLGVEAVLIRAFSEAQAYAQAREAYRKNPNSMPEPRRDLRLEALADILRGDLHVHCHCYRADEIIMLLRVADRFGFEVKSLQHVLEGYKVAPEIAAHGAACSLFADWWAYKVEAFDAIPFAAALLHEAGASVCLKSDSHELMRHLYQEAAKLVKYGGLSEIDALKAITLNPARQLGLDKRIGSIEVGKDADLAIFNGHPLNGFSRPEMTLVEGEVYFQRSEKLTRAEAAQAGPAKPRTDFKSIPVSPMKCYVLNGVTLHPASGPTISPATVVVLNGRIHNVLKGKIIQQLSAYTQDRVHIALLSIGDGTEKSTTLHLPPDLKVIDGSGVHVYPGMIDAGTVVGLIEIGSAKETHDYQEGGDFQPDLRASTGVNPESELIPVTRANGVLTVVTRPMGGLLAGQSAVLNLAGWTPREMAIKDPWALHVDFPPEGGHGGFLTDPNTPFSGRALAKRQRDDKVRRLKELFQQAAAYDAALKLNPSLPFNPRLDALRPYIQGDKPVVIFAQRKTEILEALKLADDLKVKMILSGGIDSWKVADELKKRAVPVILGPIMTMPSNPYDPYDGPFACAAKLHAAGVKFCIRSGGGSNTRNLPYEAAMAVSFGLPPEEGLKAVTLYPAEILGLQRDLGSVENGKIANLVLTNGDVLQPTTQVLSVFIQGKPLEPASKHTKLFEKYRERLKEVKDGKTPLGTK